MKKANPLVSKCLVNGRR